MQHLYVDAAMYVCLYTKNGKNILVEFLFWNFSCKDNTIYHIGIHIIIDMFNSNPVGRILTKIFTIMLVPPQRLLASSDRHPSCTMASRLLVIPQFETT